MDAEDMKPTYNGPKTVQFALVVLLPNSSWAEMHTALATCLTMAMRTQQRLLMS